MSGAGAPRVANGPPGHPPWAAAAAIAGGARIVALAQAQALLWMREGEPGELREVLATAPQLRWVHLRWAGVERFAGVLDRDRVWTAGKGVFADAVAEHALALGLAGLRGITARAGARDWGPPAARTQSTSLLDGRVTVIGAGAIAGALARMLAPLRARLTVVRRRELPFPGAERTLPAQRLDEALPGADLVVVAAALTPATSGMLGRAQLARMERHAWLVNVARGACVVTDDLVAVLREGRIGGAALDVTDPEPLPAGHPLWTLERCVITPHSASPTELTEGAQRERITENVRRFAAGRELLGVVDLDAGY